MLQNTNQYEAVSQKLISLLLKYSLLISTFEQAMMAIQGKHQCDENTENTLFPWNTELITTSKQ